MCDSVLKHPLLQNWKLIALHCGLSKKFVGDNSAEKMRVQRFVGLSAVVWSIDWLNRGWCARKEGSQESCLDTFLESVQPQPASSLHIVINFRLFSGGFRDFCLGAVGDPEVLTKSVFLLERLALRCHCHLQLLLPAETKQGVRGLIRWGSPRAWALAYPSIRTNSPSDSSPGFACPLDWLVSGVLCF